MATIRIRAFVSGRVQGVFFRTETQEQARRLRLTGWVRNVPNGRVEVLAEGDDRFVRELLSWCRTGPPHARVEQVEEIPEPHTGEFDTFSITY